VIAVIQTHRSVEPSVEQTTQPLWQLAQGSSAILAAIEGSDAERLRLLHLGFLPGRRVRMAHHRANHCVVQVGCSRYALAKAVADRIQVVILAGGNEERQ